jgi:hypothetical protein
MNTKNEQRETQRRRGRGEQQVFFVCFVNFVPFVFNPLGALRFLGLCLGLLIADVAKGSTRKGWQSGTRRHEGHKEHKEQKTA